MNNDQMKQKTVKLDAAEEDASRVHQKIWKWIKYRRRSVDFQREQC